MKRQKLTHFKFSIQVRSSLSSIDYAVKIAFFKSVKFFVRNFAEVDFQVNLINFDINLIQLS